MTLNQFEDMIRMERSEEHWASFYEKPDARLHAIYFRTAARLDCGRCGFRLDTQSMRAGACDICDEPVTADQRAAWVICCEIRPRFNEIWRRDEHDVRVYRSQWEREEERRRGEGLPPVRLNLL